jgi:hypothetical protein
VAVELLTKDLEPKEQAATAAVEMVKILVYLQPERQIKAVAAVLQMLPMPAATAAQVL